MQSSSRCRDLQLCLFASSDVIPFESIQGFLYTKMNTKSSYSFPIEGRCTCGTIKYRMETAPLIVHCCHCTYCQHETGSAFVLNAVIESSNITLLSSTEPTIIRTASLSGKGQDIARCPKCYVAVWSTYARPSPLMKFVRVGTLERALAPGVHIFTSTKMPWVKLDDEGVPVMKEYYDREKVWSKESLERRKLLAPKIMAWCEKQKEAAGAAGGAENGDSE